MERHHTVAAAPNTVPPDMHAQHTTPGIQRLHRHFYTTIHTQCALLLLLLLPLPPGCSLLSPHRHPWPFTGRATANSTVQGADGCEPFDSMDRKKVELSAQGTIYRVYDALLPTNPGPLEGDCVSSRLADAKKQNATKVHPQARQGSGVRVEPKKPAAGVSGGMWQVGYADVFVGTMAVVGDGSITSGMFEYVSEYDVYGELAEPVEVPAAEVGERTVLPEPYSITLKFYKQRTAEY